jgi:hypothetical protein
MKVPLATVVHENSKIFVVVKDRYDLFAPLPYNVKRWRVAVPAKYHYTALPHICIKPPLVAKGMGYID